MLARRGGRALHALAHACLTGYRVRVATGASNRQRLKPYSFQARYGTVETVPYKDSAVAAQALKPAIQGDRNGRAFSSALLKSKSSKLGQYPALASSAPWHRIV